MYISKKQRAEIKEMFGGRCAYSGTILEDDWQIDHVKPLERKKNGVARKAGRDVIENMMPTQRVVNHYKRGLSLEHYRKRLMTLHRRLAKLPKNPKARTSIRRKEYLLKVAEYFGITPENPFNGEFYFELYNKE